MPSATNKRVNFFGADVRVLPMLEVIEAQEALERACIGKSLKTARAIQNQNRARLAHGAKRQAKLANLYEEERPALGSLEALAHRDARGRQGRADGPARVSRVLIRGEQYFAQLRHAEDMMRAEHLRLIAEGWTWDGKDGYTWEKPIDQVPIRRDDLPQAGT